MEEADTAFKPLLICTMIVKYPHISFALGLSFHIFFVFLSLLFQISDTADVFTFVVNDVPLIDKTYTGYQCYRAMRIISSYGRIIGMIENTTFINYRILLYFDAGKGNVLESQSLKEIYNLESLLFQKMVNDRVVAYYNGTIMQPLSLPRMLLELNNNDNSFTNVNIYIDQLLNSRKYEKDLKMMLCKDFIKTAYGYSARALISVLYLGNTYEYYIGENLIYTLRDQYNSKYTYWKFYYEDISSFILNLQDAAIQDTKIVAGSLIFIYLFTYIRTRSVFLTIFGITSIFTSFFFANFIHSVICGIKFFGILHILSIFIVLSLGCDDIYVFLDRWKGTQPNTYSSLAHRLSDTYVRANWPMFIITISMTVAFSIMIFTQLLALSTFAFFLVLLVIINYVSVLLYFSTVVIVYHLHFESNSSPDRVYVYITNLFGINYYNLLCRRFIKESIVAVFIVIAIIAIFVLSFKLSISDTFPILLGSGSMYGYIKDLKEKCYKPNNFDVPLRISLISGLIGTNSSNCQLWDYWCHDDVVKDEKYKINHKEVQLRIMNICENLLNSENSLTQELGILELNGNRNDVRCFIQEMNNYFIKLYPDYSSVVPWNRAKLQNLVTKNADAYGPLTLPPDFSYSFEAAMDFWMFQGYKFDDESRRLQRDYANALFKQMTNELLPIKNGNFIGYKLPFSVILINTTMNTEVNNYYERVRIFDKWTKYAYDMGVGGPNGARHFLACSTQPDSSQTGYFHWLWVQRTIYAMVFKGIFIGIALSFIIILLGIVNIYEALLFSITTILTTLTIVCSIPVAGWKLGFLEGIYVTLVVGLSIDYIGHMCISYNQSKRVSRDERLQDMLFEMPISVISGACTTLGACVFLFFCEIKLLIQYGIFLFITVAMSTLYAVVLFPCFIGLFGPSESNGNIPNIFAILLNKMRRRNSVK